MEQNEEEELGAVALQVIEFLGQVLVQVQGILAVEEYVCEEYKASLRFVRRCVSGPSIAEAPTCRSPTGYLTNNDARSGSKSGDETGHGGEKTTIPGSDASEIQELVSLCEYMDMVLADAKHARETSPRVQVSKGGPMVIPNGGHLLSKLSVRVPSVPTTNPPDARNSNRVKKRVTAFSRTGERPKKLIPRTGTPGLSTISKSKNLRPGSAGGYDKNRRSVKACPIPIRDENSRPSLPKKIRATLQEPVKDSAVDMKNRLQFPEKLGSLLAWFSARGLSFNHSTETSTESPASAARKTFISILHDMSDQQEAEDKECRDAVLRIQETQKVLKDLTSHFDVSQMSHLLRIAPAGSKIAKQRDYCMREVLLTDKGGKAPTVEKTQNNFPAVMADKDQSTLSWLPQSCWSYLQTVQIDDFATNALRMESGIIGYSDPEQIVAIARLSNSVQAALLHCYLEDVIASPLLNISSRKEKGSSLLELFRCRLAHSILCKEGRGLLVVAEESSTTTTSSPA